MTTKTKQTELPMSELIAAVKKHAEAHYDGGWDVVVECWSDQKLCGHIMQAKAKTEQQAIASFKTVVSVWGERQADADFHRREAIGN